MMMKARAITVIGALVLCVCVVGTNAAQFTEVRIGDLDGFGYLPLGLLAANGAAADTDSDGVLEPTEFLPDLNGDGSTATGKGDDFDNRSAAEVADTAISGAGFVDNGTSGSHFTDIALSTSYDASSGAGQVFNSPTRASLPPAARSQCRLPRHCPISQGSCLTSSSPRVISTRSPASSSI